MVRTKQVLGRTGGNAPGKQKAKLAEIQAREVAKDVKNISRPSSSSNDSESEQLDDCAAPVGIKRFYARIKKHSQIIADLRMIIPDLLDDDQSDESKSKDEDVVEIVRFASLVLASRVPAAAKDELGNWLAQKVNSNGCSNALLHTLQDPNTIFGLFDATHSVPISQLLAQKAATKFRCDLELAARPGEEGEAVGQVISRKLVLNIVLFASRALATRILQDIRQETAMTRRALATRIRQYIRQETAMTRRARWNREKSPDLIDDDLRHPLFKRGNNLDSPDNEVPKEFQAEAAASRANFRVRQEGEGNFELRHPAESTSTNATKPATKLMDLEQPSTKLLVDVRSEETPASRIPHPVPVPVETAQSEEVGDTSTSSETALHQGVPDQITSAALQQVEAPPLTRATIVEAQTVFEDDVADFLEFTRSTSPEVARQYLRNCDGSLSAALKHFRKDAEARKAEVLPPLTTAAPPITLLPMALETPLKAGQRQRLLGDTVFILDGVNVARYCRLDSSDLRESSSFFKEDLSADEDAAFKGVRCVYTLQQAQGGDMPKLLRKPLNTIKEACDTEIYAVPLNEMPIQETKEIALNENESVDWQSAYEDFFCILARFRPNFCDAKDIESIIPRLEALARIANYYNSVGITSQVSTTMTDLFNRYQLEHQLWEAIAKDAGRWLLIAIQLKNAVIFKEAFVHIAGCYPEWSWTVSKTAVPTPVLESIEIKSSILQQQRMVIERELMFTTLCGTPAGETALVPVSQNIRPCSYNVVNLFLDWIRNHLGFLDKGKDAPPVSSELCSHPDDQDCLSVAGFYRRVSKGGDAYLPIEWVVKGWNMDFAHRRPSAPGLSKIKPRADHTDWDGVRRNLKTLKERARKLVQPLAEVKLHYGGRLGYLTCVEVNESDLPWEVEVKSEEDGADGREDHVMT